MVAPNSQTNGIKVIDANTIAFTTTNPAGSALAEVRLVLAARRHEAARNVAIACLLQELLDDAF